MLSECFDLHLSHLQKDPHSCLHIKGPVLHAYNWLRPPFFCAVCCFLLDFWEEVQKIGPLGSRGTNLIPSCHFFFDFPDGIFEGGPGAADFFKESSLFIFSFYGFWMDFVRN